jgi:hypothetical protein
VHGGLRLPAGAQQAHDPGVGAGEVLGADRPGAGDPELLQVAVVDDRQQLTGDRAVQVDQPAELAVGRPGNPPLPQPAGRVLDVGDDVRVDPVGRDVEVGDGPGE